MLTPSTVAIMSDPAVGECAGLAVLLCAGAGGCGGARVCAGAGLGVEATGSFCRCAHPTDNAARSRIFKDFRDDIVRGLSKGTHQCQELHAVVIDRRRRYKRESCSVVVCSSRSFALPSPQS